MPTRKLSSCWCPKQWRKCVFTASSQWSKILAGIEWYFHRGLLYLGRSWYWELYSLGQKPTQQFSRWRLCTYTWCWIQIQMEWREMQWLSSVYLQERYSFSCMFTCKVMVIKRDYYLWKITWLNDILSLNRDKQKSWKKIIKWCNEWTDGYVAVGHPWC